MLSTTQGDRVSTQTHMCVSQRPTWRILGTLRS